MTKRSGIIGCAVAILVGALGLPPAVCAGEYSRGGAFILPGWDAKGAALGGAVSVLIKDERSAYWNPANLTSLVSPRVSVGTMEPVPDLDSRYSILCAGFSFFETRVRAGRSLAPDSMAAADSAGAADSIRAGGGASASDSTLSSDTTLVWRRAAIAVSASHLGLDLAQGSKWSESTIGLSAAYAPTAHTSLGITIRMMKSWTDVANADSWGASFDAGLTERITDHAWLAVAGRNILSRVSFPEKTDTLDATWSLALAYLGLFDRISVECDAVIKYKVMNRFLVGVEIAVVPNLLSILSGADIRMTEGDRVIPSVGLATTYSLAEIVLASSFDPEDAFGRQTRVSMSFRF